MKIKLPSSELKIEQIFFLNWGNQNSIIGMDDSQAFKALLANAFRTNFFTSYAMTRKDIFLRTQLTFLNQVKNIFSLEKRQI